MTDTYEQRIGELRQAAERVVSMRVGDLPNKGWLPDNGTSRRALGDLAAALAALGISDTTPAPTQDERDTCIWRCWETNARCVCRLDAERIAPAPAISGGEQHNNALRRDLENGRERSCASAPDLVRQALNDCLWYIVSPLRMSSDADEVKRRDKIVRQAQDALDKTRPAAPAISGGEMELNGVRPDEKKATLELHLIADSSYDAESTYRISANQWAEIIRICEDAAADRSAAAPAPDMVSVPRNVVDFLCGRSPLDGVEFGDLHPTERGAFWWRKHLFAAAPAPAPQQGES